MPVREYQCSRCGETHDYLLRLDEEPAGCSGCGGPASGLRKLISAPNIGSSKKGNSECISTGIFLDAKTGTFERAYTTKEVRDDNVPGQVVADFVLESGQEISTTAREFNLDNLAG